ncbi:MAG: ABC transporter substrate-binding protein [Phenylobacterium sp.]|uniref:ABC transporter substrate-binding protein n=1 Tax=Phenylobacterium sp. TaxID=1871053 RepID=UPI0027277647|nr:ABC transporter substrate-binding protein [Phenylobacterium sp.]MDO8900769.1 ABC transporter substrate-binding protein [Phenylobacterium sp.]
MSAPVGQGQGRLTRRTAVGGLALGLAGAAPAPRPQRVVSLNPCLDVILFHVADRSQIAALTHYARDPEASTLAQLARDIPITYETAEEVVALRPDLVLMSQHSAPATRQVLARLGVPTALFDVPHTVLDSLAQVRHVAQRIGQPVRGEALIARIEAALAAAAPPPGAPRLSAIVYQANGFAAGAGTLTDEMLRRTGFENAAARYGLGRWGNIGLEQIIADPPQVLLAGAPAPGAPTWADRVLSHPALARMSGVMRREAFPQRLLYCGGPVLIETAAALAAARRNALGVA